MKTSSVEKHCIWLKSEATKSLILNVEINKIDFFLTMDRKFINALKSYKTCSLCIPIMPSELLKYLKVEQLEKFDFEVGYFHGIDGKEMFKLT